MNRMRFAAVAIPIPLHKTFAYIVPDGMRLTPGFRVLVTFRRRKTIGICMELLSGPPQGLVEEDLKEIEEVLDDRPIISSPLLELVRWVSSYYCAPIGEVCRASLPSRLVRLGASKTTRPGIPLEAEPMPGEDVELNLDQRCALDSILTAAKEHQHRVFLLHGITGSGKTEVYLRLFEELALQGRQGLLLVPEIGLTPQLTGRAVARFSDRVAVYHSGLTEAQRHMQWTKMASGEVCVAIGTRSAVFSPFANLGAIVIDEEHDPSFKQDEGVMYNGRDVAIMRTHIEGIPAILGSATPSMESLSNVKTGKYGRFVLGSRATGAALPAVEIVDMRSPGTGASGRDTSEGTRRRREFTSLSPILYDAIVETLAKREQVLLYVGRRGFAGQLQCDSCGTVLMCPNCDIPLSLHIGRALSPPLNGARVRHAGEALLCHYCGYSITNPGVCDACRHRSLMPLGHGTERLEAEIRDFFPSARVTRFDSDAVSNPKRRKKILDDMRGGRIDILVGTQMVTKGHDFPGITLVGVVAADNSLNVPDFRSAERTFQLITQVAGRAGRGTSPGRVIVQTRQPTHVSFITAADHDCERFAEQELGQRRELLYPPFSRLVNIRISSNREDTAAKASRRVADVLMSEIKRSKEAKRVAILGPAPAPLARLKGRWRWHVLVKAQTAPLMSRLLNAIRPKLQEAMPSGIHLAIDVDPVNLM